MEKNNFKKSKNSCSIQPQTLLVCKYFYWTKFKKTTNSKHYFFSDVRALRTHSPVTLLGKFIGKGPWPDLGETPIKNHNG